MSDLCATAVVKFKTYQMTNGKEIMSIATYEQKKHKWQKNMQKWHLFMQKLVAAMSMET